ncbi:PREDICTED: probable crossover junction endonuclease EME2 [Nanorana parkeri]|uniref:probable crossover junction endonuclease EME2 n=1 Tax=Nanorana parkeri TaxID=125878 RepID=UPI0008546744|nr:PREDICTED: probable crossover junction endonuclease EME2 [Nanorana parkeri]
MERVPVKVTVTSSPRKRAKTWEISDSEDEEPDCTLKGGIKGAEAEIKCKQVLDDADGGAFIQAGPEELLRDQHGGLDVDSREHGWTGPGVKAGSVEPSGLQKEQGDVHHPPTSSSLVLSLPKSTTPSPVKRSRKKKSPEELEADRAQAEEKKREKELMRQEKEKIKDLEKEEREKRKESAQALKLLRPDQCGKYMVVQVDAGLLQDAGSEDVLEALRSAGYNYSIEPHSIPCSITWKREMPADWTCVEGLELCKGEEEEMLILVEPGDFLKSVSCYVQVRENSRTCETASSVFGMDRKCPGKKITLAVLGLHDYRRYQRLSHKMERHSLEPRHYYDEQPESHVTKHHIDEALVFLQLYHETEVLFWDTWRELGQYVCAVTKSIAQRPFRLHWEAQSYSFCTSAGTWRGWGPKGSLAGLPLAWKRQIQQLNRVSPAMAAAITEAYPSPQLLMQAYVACNTDKERLSLLSNLRIPRAAGTTDDMNDPDEDITRPDDQDQARERRIGPDLSRRIWLFMTSANPELVLDLNS